jgi:hypothetical protein
VVPLSCAQKLIVEGSHREKIATKMWTKLKSLYMTKSLVMSETTTKFIQDGSVKFMVDQVRKFKKIIDDLQNIEVELDG